MNALHIKGNFFRLSKTRKKHFFTNSKTLIIVLRREKFQSNLIWLWNKWQNRNLQKDPSFLWSKSTSCQLVRRPNRPKNISRKNIPSYTKHEGQDSSRGPTLIRSEFSNKINPLVNFRFFFSCFTLRLPPPHSWLIPKRWNSLQD